jgi:hypothetical protein
VGGVPDVTRDHEVPVPPEAVSAVVQDLPGWPSWFALHKGWVEDPPARAALGVRFRHRVRVLGVPAEMAWEVVELDPPRRFAIKGKGSQRTNATVVVDVVPLDGGRSRIRIEAEIGGLVLRPVKGQLRSWLEPRVQRTLAALEAEARERG